MRNILFFPLALLMPLVGCTHAHKQYQNFQVVNAHLQRIELEDSVYDDKCVYLLELGVKGCNSARTAGSPFLGGIVDSVLSLTIDDAQRYEITHKFLPLKTYKGYGYHRLRMETYHKHVFTVMYADSLEAMVNTLNTIDVEIGRNWEEGDGLFHFYRIFYLEKGGPVPRYFTLSFPDRKIYGTISNKPIPCFVSELGNDKMKIEWTKFYENP